jgi:hypothetical protein
MRATTGVGNARTIVGDATQARGGGKWGVAQPIDLARRLFNRWTRWPAGLRPLDFRLEGTSWMSWLKSVPAVWLR